MFTRLLMAGVLACLLVGCAKKPKYTGRDDDTAGVVTPGVPTNTGTPTARDKNPAAGKQTEKANWLNDPRFKPKDQLPVETPTKPGWGVTPPKGGWDGPTPPQVGGNPPMPPMGVPQPPANPPAKVNPSVVPPSVPAAPGGKVVTKDDMKEVWIFIENFSLASGKMPPPELVYAALVEAKSPAADLVKSGYIILTGAKAREGVWAFERNAPSQGGWVATQNGAEQVTAREFAQRVGR